ncbi:MAG: hypothetical protein V4719_24225 [Planctomycetota bacterium]
MATHAKDVLREGIFRKGTQYIRVSKEDLALACLNFEKMKSMGYRAPIIIEHSTPGDPQGLPVHRDQMSARDKAKYQAGWSEDLRLNDQGILEVVMDVKSADGLRLINEVGTYVSPQFGPWTFPGESEPTPMVITHFALTPYPVDIGQNPEFRRISETSPVNATQLSQLVSFSMANMIPDLKQPTTKIPATPDAKTAPETPPLNDQLPGHSEAAVWQQIGAALKLSGVILPQGAGVVDTPQALLAALRTCAQRQNEAPAPEAAVPQRQAASRTTVPGQDPNQDPRLNGTKQENTFTMSTTNASQTPLDIKTLPEFVQMSQNMEVLIAENSKMRRAEYANKIKGLQDSGRISPALAQKFLATVGTYQFSATTTSTDFVKLDAQLELAETLPVGAVWSPDQRISQMSLQEHKSGAFFDITGANMDPAAEDAELDRRLGKFHP